MQIDLYGDEQEHIEKQIAESERQEERQQLDKAYSSEIGGVLGEMQDFMEQKRMIEEEAARRRRRKARKRKRWKL